MNRREDILDILRRRRQRVTGTELARELGVSRQVIVQDIALLRAEGNPILATPQGYLVEREAIPRTALAVLAVRHAPDQTAEELSLLVGIGLTVVDVIVDHPLYGELRGALMLRVQADVDRFMESLRAKGTALLSSLTDGVHLHTVEYGKPSDLARAQAALARHGFLLTE
jgi:transcriptional regulator of NAD metabolism